MLRQFVGRQQTIASVATLSGIGVHSAAPCRVRLRPAPADTGIVFVRTDVTDRDNAVAAHVRHVSSTANGTTLRNSAGVEAATVEHLLAAVRGLEIDNLIVEMSGPETPILDGSAGPFVRALMQAGLRLQAAPLRRLRVLEPVSVRDGAKAASLLPAAPGQSHCRFDVTIRFSDPAIGVQRRVFDLSRRAFLDEIAQARTFGFLADLERLRAARLAQGSSLENTVAVERGRVVNPEGLRFHDEFVRHKILDAVGDVALAGAPIVGQFVGDQPGHALNTALIRALMDRPSAWVLEEALEAELAAAG